MFKIHTVGWIVAIGMLVLFLLFRNKGDFQYIYRVKSSLVFIDKQNGDVFYLNMKDHDILTISLRSKTYSRDKVEKSVLHLIRGAFHADNSLTSFSGELDANSDINVTRMDVRAEK